jgi:hypothetical protein
MTTGWGERIASSKGAYTVGFFLIFSLLNLVVVLTYEWTGRVSFSSLTLGMVFEAYMTGLTGYRGVGTVVFAIVTIALFREITRMQGIAWLLLILMLLSAIPFIDFSKMIFI